MPEAEVLLLTLQEVFVYRVPPLKAASGHRAEDWGLENPVFTGSLKIMGCPSKECCNIRLHRPPPAGAAMGTTPELFVCCTVDLGKGRALQQTVENVMDSSRYFVLRCEDRASKRVAYVGIGFRERSTAFDFKAALDDFARSQERSRRAAALHQDDEGGEEDGQEMVAAGRVKQIKDLSLQEGKKIHIETPGGSGHRRRRTPNKTTTSESPLKLAPPPPAGSVMRPPSKAAEEVDGADEWGDFASAD